MKPIPVEHARALAAELLRELTPHAGDPAAVSATLLRWAEDVGPSRLAVVCMAATQAVFADCLTPTTREDWPDAGLALITPEEGTHTDD